MIMGDLFLSNDFLVNEIATFVATMCLHAFGLEQNFFFSFWHLELDEIYILVNEITDRSKRLFLYLSNFFSFWHLVLFKED